MLEALIVATDGRTIGTIGGGCAEAEVRLRALQVLDENQLALYLVNLLNDVAKKAWSAAVQWKSLSR